MAEPVNASYLLVGSFLDEWDAKYFRPPVEHFVLMLTVTLIMVAVLVALSGFCEWLQQKLELLQGQKLQNSLEQAKTNLEVRNKAGVVVRLGKGGCANIYYCGRRFGIGQIQGSDGYCGPNNGPQCPDCKGMKAQIGAILRTQIQAIRFSMGVLHIIMPILTSILVVPFVKIMLYYIVCFSSNSIGQIWLSEVSSCKEEYNPILSAGVAFVLILYLWLVVPFSVVQGDVRYVQRRELFSMRSWKDNCTLKAGVLNLGHLTLRKRHAFRLQFTLLVLKWGLSLSEFLLKPFVVACAASYLVLVLLCSASILTVDAYIFRPTNVVLRGLVLCVDWAFVVGLLCATQPNPADVQPFFVMALGSILIFIYVTQAMRSLRKMPGEYETIDDDPPESEMPGEYESHLGATWERDARRV